ncbi:MAG: hypothetical protein ABI955_08555, partial [Nitrospirota bacterium]
VSYQFGLLSQPDLLHGNTSLFRFELFILTPAACRAATSTVSDLTDGRKAIWTLGHTVACFHDGEVLAGAVVTSHHVENDMATAMGFNNSNSRLA